MTKILLKMAVALGAIVILLLVEFSQFHDFFYPFRILWDQGDILELSLSVIIFFWSLVGTFLLFFSGRSLFRTITLPFFIFFFIFNIGTLNIANSPLDFQQAVIIVENFRWWFWAVIENYGLAILPGILVLVPMIIFVERLPLLSQVNLPPTAYFVPASATILIIIGLHTSHGFFDRYPSFFRIPSMLVFAGISSVYDGERSEVTYSDSLDTQVEKIVLIVDESIRADILGINGYNKETTPYLQSLERGIVNYGLASSATNCSDYSNLILRTGIKKEDIPDLNQMTLKQPSIWQFTRKAGFYNVYMDAQSAESWANYQNFMNEHEASFIDEIIRVRQEIPYTSDGVAREKLVALLKQPGKTFIMLNKYGMHFPYFRSHPKEYNFFTPALELGEPMNDRERSLNSFMNGVRWSVDDWFKTLLSESGEFKRYVMIYTSDHGQNIVDDGTLATHCRPRANRFEGIVPMIIFANDEDILKTFKASQTSGFDKTSQFQVFPTLLGLAGYKDSWIRSHYGASLSEPPTILPEFFVGDLHGRGSIRQWVSIFPTKAESE